MNPPPVYMCSPSWTLLPPPSPYHPSGSSQCSSPKHPVSCIKPGLASHFIHDILRVSMPCSCLMENQFLSLALPCLSSFTSHTTWSRELFGQRCVIWTVTQLISDNLSPLMYAFSTLIVPWAHPSLFPFHAFHAWKVFLVLYLANSYPSFRFQSKCFLL